MKGCLGRYDQEFSMFYLMPYERLSINTSLSVGEAEQVLPTRVSKRVMRWFPRGNEGFEGDAAGSKFDINRVIGYRNSFLPHLYGSFHSQEDGKTRVDITIKMPVVTEIFMGIWSAPWLFIAVAFLLQRQVLGLLCMGPALLLYSVIALTFNYELGKARAFISGVFAQIK
jgi:hypothetical protein